MLAAPPELNVTAPNAIYFDMTDGGDIKQAKLGLFIRRVETTQNKETLILLYTLGIDKTTNRLDRVHYDHIPLVLNSTNTGRWYEFDVTGPVKSWIRDPNSNYGMAVVANDMNGHPLVVTTPSNSGERENVSLSACEL